MQGKYITSNIRMACARKRTPVKKSIHDLLEETIAERKRILQQLEKYTQTARTVEMILAGSKAA
jgi:hypothetical protein